MSSVARSLFPADSSETELAFKLDHHIDDRSFLATRYAFSRGRISNEVHGLDNFADRSSRGSSLTRDHALTAAYTSAAARPVLRPAGAVCAPRFGSHAEQPGAAL
ncbi:MAG: hypothetical protein R2748_30775 [Bryobacterales bacterium]